MPTDLIVLSRPNRSRPICPELYCRPRPSGLDTTY